MSLFIMTPLLLCVLMSTCTAQETKWLCGAWPTPILAPCPTDAVCSATTCMYTPQKLAFNPIRNIAYVSEVNGHRIRGVPLTATELVVTLAGDRTAHTPGNAVGIFTATRFRQPKALKLSRSNLLFVVDHGNHQIKFLNLQIRVSANYAGTGTAGIATNCLRLVAQFSDPSGIDIHLERMYIADTSNTAVRRIHMPSGITTPLVNTSPHDISVLKILRGMIYGVFASSSHAIRVYNVVTGVGNIFLGSDGVSGDSIAPGNVRFNGPEDIEVACNRKVLFLADTANNRVKQIVIGTSVVTNAVGTGTPTWKGDTVYTSSNANLREPKGIVVAGSQLLIADGGHRVYTSTMGSAEIPIVACVGTVTRSSHTISSDPSNSRSPSLSLTDSLSQDPTDSGGSPTNEPRSVSVTPSFHFYFPSISPTFEKKSISLTLSPTKKTFSWEAKTPTESRSLSDDPTDRPTPSQQTPSQDDPFFTPTTSITLSPGHTPEDQSYRPHHTPTITLQVVSQTLSIKSRTPSNDHPSTSVSLARTLPTPTRSAAPNTFTKSHSPYTPTDSGDVKPFPTLSTSLTVSDSVSRKKSMSPIGSMSISESPPRTLSSSLTDSYSKHTPSFTETRHRTRVLQGSDDWLTETATVSSDRIYSATGSLRNVSFVTPGGTELLDLFMKSRRGHMVQIEIECCSFTWNSLGWSENSLFLTSAGSIYSWEPALDVKKFSVTGVVAGDNAVSRRFLNVSFFLRPEDEGAYNGRLVVNMRQDLFQPRPIWPSFSLDFEVAHRDPPADKLSDVSWYLQGTANVLVLIASMSTIFTLSVGGAVQAGRFQGMFIGTFCNLNEVHLSSIMHPTQIQIGTGGESVPEYLGAFVVQMFIVVFFSIGHWIFVYIWYLRKVADGKRLVKDAHDRGEAVIKPKAILFSSVAGMFRFPSLSMWLTFYFMPIILTGAMYVTTHSNDTAVQTIAVIIVCVFLTSTLLIMHITVGRAHLSNWRFHDSLPTKPLELFLFCCFQDQGEWMNAMSKNTRFIERYGSLFYHYTPKHQWFVIIETLMMFTIASVSAVIPSHRQQCKITSGGMIAVFGMYTVVLLVLRPYNNFRTQVLQTTVAGAQTVACCVGLLAVIFPNNRFMLTNLAQVVGLLAAMVNLSEAILALIVIFLHKKRMREKRLSESRELPSPRTMVSGGMTEMQEVTRGGSGESSPRGSYEAPHPPPPMMRETTSCQVFVTTDGIEQTFPPTSGNPDHTSNVDWKKVYHML